MTEGIREGLTALNPYRKNEAETMAFSEGMKSAQNGEVGVFVNAMRDGAYIKVKGVDFRSQGASDIIARVGTTHNGGGNPGGACRWSARKAAGYVAGTYDWLGMTVGRWLLPKWKL